MSQCRALDGESIATRCAAPLHVALNLRGDGGEIAVAAMIATGIYEMTSPRVGTRPPSTSRIVQCEPEAKDLPLSGAGAALTRHRFPGCGRRWRPRAL